MICRINVFLSSFPDPKKANQVERLGMGVSKKGGVSHSAIMEIATIDQEEPDSFRSTFASRSKKSANNFEDEFEIIGDDWKSSTNNNSKFDFDTSPSGGGSSNWEKEFEVMKSTSKFDTKTSDDNKWSNTFDEQPKRGSDR